MKISVKIFKLEILNRYYAHQIQKFWRAQKLNAQKKDAQKLKL